MTPKTKQRWSSHQANKQGNETQIWAQFRLRQFYGDLSESILWQETTCTTSPSTSRQSDLTRRRGLGFTSSPLFVIWRFGCGDTPSLGIIGREWLNQVFIARLYFGVSSFVRGLLVQIKPAQIFQFMEIFVSYLYDVAYSVCGIRRSERVIGSSDWYLAFCAWKR